MAEAIRMPLLSDTMKEGVIAEWHKKVGDTVKSDDVIAEVETDKATMEVMPYVDGTLLYIGVEKGKGVPVNGIMAIIGKPGEDFQGILDAEKGGAKADAPKEEAPKQEQPKEEAPKQEAPKQAAPAQPQQAAPAQPAAQTDDRLKASPLAKKVAQEKGIDIQAVKGSGDGGRIIKRDVESYTPSAAPQPQKATMQMVQAMPAGQEGHTDTPISQMRRIIAQRLGESKFSAPHFYLRMTMAMDKAIEARKAINEVSPVKVSFNDLVIKACAMALRQHPAVNSSWMGDFIRQNHHIHIGTAVAVDEGLIVPVIKFADQKSLSQIAQEAGSLIDKARTKKIQPQEFTGNTFTISNLGMMDIDEFTAIINPPDSCILAVGKITPTPVVENGQVVVRNLMKVTLSCDHRSVDGSVGAKFLQTLKTFIENPVTMMV
ncbi:MAG: pyruvate dehydrogenase complex dihydrolipoamide acetyltransferase [Flavipsychrobacter sp.]|jgi:pyruvate dehydrogenase E2 component (dihydrolipoamide acetyltransferase)|nr:pyruvate dehydrogenase complex dihydrolipoamide acetyltransferase [Flavipsychrobacter sp.]